MTKMLDVAKHAGVSVATVSNVLTKKKYVSEDTARRVEASINELGYMMNTIARGLKTNKTNTVGVILPDITKMFFPDVLRGIEDSAMNFGYVIQYFSSNYDFNREKQHVERLKGGRVDGIILDSCCDDKHKRSWAQELSRSTSDNRAMFPVVSIERKLNPKYVSSVVIDNCRAVENATNYLINMGRRNILCITSHVQNSIGMDRLNGYKQALKKAGMPIRDDYILPGDFTSNAAYIQTQNSLRSGISFDAIMAANDQSAIGALKALRQHNIKVPEQVAIIGFDNLFPTTLVSPQISTIDVPRHQMGKIAFELLVEKIQNDASEHRCITLDVEFVERQSTNEKIGIDYTNESKSEWNTSKW